MIKAALGFIIGATFAVIFLGIINVKQYKSDRAIFEKAVMFTVDYRNKYGEYPSSWLWNKVYENPNANIDSLKLIQDSISTQFKSLK